MAKLHSSTGTELISGAAIEGFDTSDREVTGLLLADGRRLPADVVGVGIGAAPNIEWLEGSGVNLCDGLPGDSMGRTNVPGIVAVGDCAAWFEGGLCRHRRVEQWTGALERAALAVQAKLKLATRRTPTSLPSTVRAGPPWQYLA
ncbi:FAD-dependent oxidoreductase [Arthrobacter oryzae]|uniref:FAD-dependent oxidoreductase n=1 Tax=Arthrobacter oryzae TaxID=409290 RepID=UPI0027D77F02|nr:FAD-dependent oxidoreductase [Arthrobacter oryzae]